jgi:hypothetical protein
MNSFIFRYEPINFDELPRPAAEDTYATYAASCPTCNDLVPQIWDEHMKRHYFSLHLNLTQLQESADRGCSACQVIKDGYEHFAKQTIGLEKDHGISITNCPSDLPIRYDGLEVKSYHPSLSLFFHFEQGSFYYGRFWLSCSN